MSRAIAMSSAYTRTPIRTARQRDLLRGGIVKPSMLLKSVSRGTLRSRVMKRKVPVSHPEEHQMLLKCL